MSKESYYEQIFERYDVVFHYDTFDRTWCLSWRRDDLEFETDDYSAPNRDAALADAVEYLHAYHEDIIDVTDD